MGRCVCAYIRTLVTVYSADQSGFWKKAPWKVVVIKRKQLRWSSGTLSYAWKSEKLVQQREGVLLAIVVLQQWNILDAGHSPPFATFTYI